MARKGIPHERLVAMISDMRDRGLRVVQQDENHCVYYGMGKCHDPVVRELYARPSPSHRDPVRGFKAAVKALWPGSVVTKGLDLRPGLPRHITVRAGPRVAVQDRTKVPISLTLVVRCRKCESCRRLRAMQWSMRAKAETEAAPRTWFGTLTLRPEAHMTMVSRARARLSAQGIDFDALPFGEQFTERHNGCSVEITKYLKRVRKQSDASFRYLLVCEHHQSGLPHYHILLHEMAAGSVKHATLSSQWQLGFEKYRVVTEIREATYLCKYLSKATVARVRASRGYGEGATHRKIPEGVVTFGRNPGFPELDPGNSASGVTTDARERGLPRDRETGVRPRSSNGVINSEVSADSVFVEAEGK